MWDLHTSSSTIWIAWVFLLLLGACDRTAPPNQTDRLVVYGNPKEAFGPYWLTVNPSTNPTTISYGTGESMCDLLEYRSFGIIIQVCNNKLFFNDRYYTDLMSGDHINFDKGRIFVNDQIQKGEEISQAMYQMIRFAGYPGYSIGPYRVVILPSEEWMGSVFTPSLKKYSLKHSNLDLEIIEGALMINGSDFGLVEEGDKIIIEDGEVYVCFEKRGRVAEAKRSVPQSGGD